MLQLFQSRTKETTTTTMFRTSSDGIGSQTSSKTMMISSRPPSSNRRMFCWNSTVVGIIICMIVVSISSSTSSSLSSSSSSASSIFVDAIVGGTVVHHPSKHYPGFVWTGIRPKLGWGCGGALIHPDIVLTAAHCQWVYNYDDTVFINPQSITGGGESMGDDDDDEEAIKSINDSEVEIRTVQSRLIHPKFIDPAEDPSQLIGSYDVMLVKLDKPVSSNIEPFKYNLDPSEPPPAVTTDDDENNSFITIIGFGTVSEDETNGPEFSTFLREVTVNEFDYDACNATYAKPPSETNDGGNVDPMTQLCTGTIDGGKDGCGSDSGCPMMVPITTTADSSTDNAEATTTQMVVVGIVNDGIGCGRPSVPSINARVSGYQDWIQSSICEISDSPPPSCQKKKGDATKTMKNNNSNGGNDRNDIQMMKSTVNVKSEDEKSGYEAHKTTMFGGAILVVLVLTVTVVLFRRRQCYRHRSDGYDSIP